MAGFVYLPANVSRWAQDVGSVSTQAAGHMFAWLKSRGRFLRLFDIVIAPSIAQCCSGDPVGPSKFTRDAKAPDGQPPRGRLFNEAAKASRLAAAPLPFFSQKFLQRSVV